MVGVYEHLTLIITNELSTEIPNSSRSGDTLEIGLVCLNLCSCNPEATNAEDKNLFIQLLDMVFEVLF